MGDDQEERTLLIAQIRHWEPGPSEDPAQERTAIVRLLELVTSLVDLDTKEIHQADEGGDTPLTIEIQTPAVEELIHLTDALRRLDRGAVEPILRKPEKVSWKTLRLHEEKFRDNVIEAYRILRSLQPHRPAGEIQREIARKLGIQPWTKVRDMLKNMPRRKA